MKSTKLGCLYSLPIFFVFDLVGEIVVAMEASAVSASNAPEFFSISLMDLSADPPQHQKVCTRFWTSLYQTRPKLDIEMSAPVSLQSVA